MQIMDFSQGRSLVARLDHGADIISQITSIAVEMEIKAGYIAAIGALGRAEIGYYDQSRQKYEKIGIEEPTELVSCLGNISLLDGQPFVHAHAVLSSGNGTVWAGHLNRGEIFAAELFIQELLGPDLIRVPDFVTGLKLWREE